MVGLATERVGFQRQKAIKAKLLVFNKKSLPIAGGFFNVQFLCWPQFVQQWCKIGFNQAFDVVKA